MTRFARTLCWSTLVLLLVGPAGADETDLAALARPGTQAVMRHAEAPGVGDPAGFRLGDCATQRNLDEAGRAQARRIGEILRRAGIAFDRVLTSRWCRAADTARLLGLGAVEEAEELNSFFGEGEKRAEQTAAVKRRLAELGRTGRKAVLVTHQVNITALTGVYPASGEIVVVATDPRGELAVVGRIRTE